MVDQTQIDHVMIRYNHHQKRMAKERRHTLYIEVMLIVICLYFFHRIFL